MSELAKKSLENVTGKGSFGYIVPEWDGTFALHNDGQNILSVAAVIIEHNFRKLYQSGSSGTVPAGGLVILPTASIPPLDFIHGDSLTAFITAKAGNSAKSSHLGVEPEVVHLNTGSRSGSISSYADQTSIQMNLR